MSQKFNLNHEISMRGMKMLDIGYIFVIGSIVECIVRGCIFSRELNNKLFEILVLFN